jgi:hypothetical protein
MTAAVLEETRTEWFEDARLAILRLALTEETFTADSLRKVMRPAPNPYWPGLAFGYASRDGLIEWMGYQKSTTKSRKNSPVSIWRCKEQGVTK